MDKFNQYYNLLFSKKAERRLIRRINLNFFIMIFLIIAYAIALICVIGGIIELIIGNIKSSSTLISIFGGIIVAIFVWALLLDFFEPLKKYSINEKMFIYTYLFREHFNNLSKHKFIKRFFLNWRMEYFLNRISSLLFNIKGNFNNLFVFFDAKTEIQLIDDVRNLVPKKVLRLIRVGKEEDKVLKFFDSLLNLYGKHIQGDFLFLKNEKIDEIISIEKEDEYQSLKHSVNELDKIIVEDGKKRLDLIKAINGLLLNRKLQLIGIILFALTIVWVVVYAIIKDDKQLQELSAIFGLITVLVTVVKSYIQNNHKDKKDNNK